eukprot:8884739-Pyramimonas_sp.AAC.1
MLREMAQPARLSTFTTPRRHARGRDAKCVSVCRNGRRPACEFARSNCNRDSIRSPIPSY